MNPSRLNLFMKKFTRERVVPTISASVSCEIFGTTLPRLVLLAVARQQQQRARQPLLARVEELIDQVLLDADVPRQHVRDEAVRQRVLLVQQPRPSAFLSIDAGRVLGVIAVALPMRTGWPARHPSPKKSPGPSIATTASLPVFESTDSFTPPVLDVHDALAAVALREDRLVSPVFHDLFREAGRIEKRLRVEVLCALAVIAVIALICPARGSYQSHHGICVQNSTPGLGPRPYDGTEVNMLGTIAAILLVLWLLGIVTSYTMGGFIHILVVVAIVVVLIRIIQGRRVLP